jgi:pyrroloquinoline quinone biosynthesis protein B
MRLHVLGSAAGGGFPQWNCNCPNCDGLRKGTIKARARTQSSITVSGDNENWVLFNASPDILTQFQRFPALQPARALRDTAVKAIVLIDGQIDHTTGLYMLREHRQPHQIWCTPPVRQDLTEGNPLFRLLGHYCGIEWNELGIDDREFTIAGAPGLKFRAHALCSNAPPYSPRRDRPVPGDNVGVTIEDTNSGRKIYYAPGLVEIEPQVWAAMQAADVVLVDGTCWSDDEMIALGASKKRSRDMGHLAQSGPGGMIEWLDRLPKSTRKILIHINNTNPILNEDSPQRRELDAHGIEVSYDGMDITL